MNVDNDRIANINNRWNNQIGGLHNWHNRYPDRMSDGRHSGDDVRHHFSLLAHIRDRRQLKVKSCDGKVVERVETSKIAVAFPPARWRLAGDWGRWCWRW